MIVKPDKVNIDASILPDYPGCIAIVPSTTSFNINLPTKTVLKTGEEPVSSIHIHRSGLGNENIYSVTDYWTQVIHETIKHISETSDRGMSCTLLHISFTKWHP